MAILGMVRQWQEFFYDKRYVATPLVAPDFVSLANAFGIRGERVTTRKEVVPTIEAARANGSAGAAGLPRRAGRLGLSDGAGGRFAQRHDSPPKQPVGGNRHRAMGLKSLPQVAADSYLVLNPG